MAVGPKKKGKYSPQACNSFIFQIAGYQFLCYRAFPEFVQHIGQIMGEVFEKLQCGVWLGGFSILGPD